MSAETAMMACVLVPHSVDAPLDSARSAALVALAQDFSPRFEVVAPGVVLVDVRGLDRLIGHADAVGAALCRLARARLLRVTVALAPTRTAALILALAAVGRGGRGGRADAGRASYRVVKPGETAAALAPLPLTVLTALRTVETATASVDADTSPPAARAKGRGRGSGRHYRLAPSPGASPYVDRHVLLGDLLQTLNRWGVKTLGAFTALPSIELFERLGTDGLAWQAVARGEDTRPLVRTVIEDPFEATMALEWPIDTLEPLSFVLGRLLEPLCQRLARAERGAAALHTTLHLVSRVAHLRVLELPTPMRDAKVLRTLILLDLESHPPDAGIDRVTVTIAPTPGRVVQHSLLTRARPSPEQMATLTARLTAVFGEGRVGSPALVDTYEPGAFALCGFDGDANLSVPAQQPLVEELPSMTVSRARAPHAGFVLRRFREPIPVRVEHRRGRPMRITAPADGLYGGRIVQAAGPWRTSGAWWTGGSSPQETLVGPGFSQAGQSESEKAKVKSQKSRRTRSEPEARSPEPGARSPEPGARSLEPGACPWDHDEWDVVVGDGTVLRLSRDRITDAWFIEGILD